MMFYCLSFDCFQTLFQEFAMSLLQMFSGLLDQHGDTAQQAALLAYLKQGEEAQPYLEAVLTVSPNKQYLGILMPTTPATQGPVHHHCIMTIIKLYLPVWSPILT